MADLRLPNITATSTEGQLSQLKTYLYQLTNQLNFALKSAEDIEKEKGYSSLSVSENSAEIKSDEEKAQETFYVVKNLIIKSADIVNAYYEKISTRLSGEYVAQSDFGTYKEETNALIEQTSTNLTQNYYSKQEVDTEIDKVVRNNGCYIKTGYLDDNHTIAGFEVGEVRKENGAEVEIAFARFTTDSLEFYDGSTKVAWIDVGNSEQMLKIQNATINNKLKLNGYLIDASDGLMFTWVG